ncbi:hypothetical protein [Thalassobacillus pellis]|uniref:hypothetical protein n=1 Tax=Thalassobacillus pellis TaxID=748008 RepID=UPI00195F5C5C|nr:hypothetical protein [Thalassobacillus pellis]MBM7552020.1 hypothetical protein [Thalassobacillus pellis]
MILVAVLLCLIGTLGFTKHAKKSKVVGVFYTLSLICITASLIGTFFITGGIGDKIMIIGGIVSILSLIAMVFTKPEQKRSNIH